MATQNIAIPTSENAEQILNLASHIFEAHGKDIGDAVINKNWITANLRAKAEEKINGALDFAEPVLKTKNTNTAYRSHYTGIPAAIQDPLRELKFEPKTLDGTLVINKKHLLMNQGRAAIKKLMKTLKLQADSTLENTVNDGMWAETPGADEPESIRSIIPDDPTTGSIGGFDRASNTWARSKVNSTTIASIGTVAGLKALHKFRITLGGSRTKNADLAVTTADLFGALYGYMDDKRRLRSEEQMTKLGFDNFYIGPAMLSFDGDGAANECPANHFYFLNTKCLFLKILEGGNFVFEPFSRKDNSLNATSVFYAFLNMTTNLPSSMGVLTDITA